MRRAVIVQGLGFGDEGKGATVDFLARELAADLVVRYCGGSQAAHNVVLPSGARHVFSQFGAGTFAGANTYLARNVIMHLPALRAEAAHLESLGVEAPLSRLFVHPRALVTTDYAQLLNRIRESARGDARHGSCGHGIGETRRYWLDYGADAITAADLMQRDLLWDKLELQRQRMMLELQEIRDARELTAPLASDLIRLSARDLADELADLAAPLQLSRDMPEYQTVIFEGAQGVLLDEWCGFHPYTTWSTVTQDYALELAAESGVEELCALGVTRAYATRHGAGPFPTEDPSLRLVDGGNPWNAWQQSMRFGHLDLVLLDYAIAACGGKLDGLAVNCLDEVGETLQLGAAYEGLPSLLPAPGADLKRQAELTGVLERAKPRYETVSREQLLDRLATRLPIAIAGYGATCRQRKLGKLTFRGKSALAA